MKYLIPIRVGQIIGVFALTFVVWGACFMGFVVANDALSERLDPVVCRGGTVNIASLTIDLDCDGTPLTKNVAKLGAEKRSEVLGNFIAGRPSEFRWKRERGGIIRTVSISC